MKTRDFQPYTTPQGCIVRRRLELNEDLSVLREHVELSTIDIQRHDGRTWPQQLPNRIEHRDLFHASPEA